MGRVINASCHITAKVPTVADVALDEILLQKRFPDWEVRIAEYIQKALGPSTDPDRLHHLTPRDLVKVVLLWVNSRDPEVLS